MEKKKNNVVKMQRSFQFNIGVVVFLFIFIYICFNIFSYLTTKHVSVYEVEQGTIAENTTYYGLILREEKLIPSDYSGYIDYYLRDCGKTSYNNLIYSVDETGVISNELKDTIESDQELDDQDYNDLIYSISNFQKNYHSDNFSQVYQFKEQLSAQVMEAVNKSALETLDGNTDININTPSFHMVNGVEPGIVTYIVDGLEDVTTDTFISENMNTHNYEPVNLKQNTMIEAGETAYKLITSEEWNIVISVSDSIYERMKDSDVIEIKFKQDDVSCWVNYTLRDLDNKHYVIFSLHNHMIRYAQDRFVEIDLVLDEESGLKIPKTSITENQFYTVPKDYFINNKTTRGILADVVDEEGRVVTQVVDASIYMEDETSYYILPTDIVKAGLVIHQEESASTYTLVEPVVLRGVYNVNKGYALFKYIEILYENEEYAIIKSKTDYGISLYDHIALEGDKITEGAFLH